MRSALAKLVLGLSVIISSRVLARFPHHPLPPPTNQPLTINKHEKGYNTQFTLVGRNFESIIGLMYFVWRKHTRPVTISHFALANDYF